MRSWVIRMDVPNIKVCYRRSPYKPSLPCCSLGYSLGYLLGYSSWVTHRVLLTVLPVALRTVLFVAVLFTAIRGTYIVANTFTRLCLLCARSGVFWTAGIYSKNSWKCSTAALAPEHAEHPPSISSTKLTGRVDDPKRLKNCVISVCSRTRCDLELGVLCEMIVPNDLLLVVIKM